jgi:surface antigen
VTGRAPGPAFRGSAYSVYGWRRLWQALLLRHPVRGAPSESCAAALIAGLRRTGCALFALGIALMTTACGMSAKFALPGTGTSADANATTNSEDLISALSTGAFSDDDLIAASVTAAALLAHGKGGRWENPQSGARGTITPIATVYRDNGAECRDFLVSYVHDNAQAWMRGEACRDGGSHWEVRSLKPWRR